MARRSVTSWSRVARVARSCPRSPPRPSPVSGHPTRPAAPPPRTLSRRRSPGTRGTVERSRVQVEPPSRRCTRRSFASLSLTGTRSSPRSARAPSGRFWRRRCRFLCLIEQSWFALAFAASSEGVVCSLHLPARRGAADSDSDSCSGYGYGYRPVAVAVLEKNETTGRNETT